VGRVRAIFFDAGATLFRERSSRAAIYAEVARGHGLEVDGAQVAAAMRASHAELPRQVGGAFRYSRPWFERFIADVFARVGHPRLPTGVAPELFARFVDAATFRLFDDVVPTLTELAARGIMLGVVSNWSETLEELLGRLGLARRFRVVLASAREGVEKPEPELFRRALERAGVAAAEALHVGDQIEKDVAGARAAGITPVLLDRERAHRDFDGASIVGLGELLLLPLILEGTDPTLA